MPITSSPVHSTRLGSYEVRSMSDQVAELRSQTRMVPSYAKLLSHQDLTEVSVTSFAIRVQGNRVDSIVTVVSNVHGEVHATIDGHAVRAGDELVEAYELVAACILGLI